SRPSRSTIFTFNQITTTAIYTPSLHDALPICRQPVGPRRRGRAACRPRLAGRARPVAAEDLLPERALNGDPAARRTLIEEVYQRSEEHTSELQSRENLVCRLLL